MHGQTKANRYRRKSRLSRRRRGGMPSQVEVTAALAALDQVSVLCNPAALTRIATIRAVLESVYPQQPAPVAQAAPAPVAQAAPAMRQSTITRAQQEADANIGWGSGTSSMGSGSGDQHWFP